MFSTELEAKVTKYKDKVKELKGIQNIPFRFPDRKISLDGAEYGFSIAFFGIELFTQSRVFRKPVFR